MKHYVAKEIICPFYKQEEPTRIHCEGFCKSNSLQISFAKKELLQLHRERHCKNFVGYPMCPLFPVINKQYEEVKRHK